jgi:hypothetical protein
MCWHVGFGNGRTRYYAPRIRASGAQAVFYQTWGRRDGDAVLGSFLEMNRKTAVGYASYATEVGLLLGPTQVATVHVGDAFSAV